MAIKVMMGKIERKVYLQNENSKKNQKTGFNDAFHSAGLSCVVGLRDVSLGYSNGSDGLGCFYNSVLGFILWVFGVRVVSIG